MHKTLGSIKKEGVLLLLVDFFCLFFYIFQIKNHGFEVPAALPDTLIDLAFIFLIDIWWLQDAKKWIKDSQVMKQVKMYLLMKAILFCAIAIFAHFINIKIAIAIVVITLCYLLFGMVGLVKLDVKGDA